MEPDSHQAESNIVAHVIEIKDVSTANQPGNKICKGAPCGFSDAGTIIKDSQERYASMRKLFIAVILCVIFMAVEVVGGIKANSLAILTDAAHLLSDVAAFAISLFSLWASGWEANPRQSYGFFRIEILGALVSIQLIWLLSGILVYEAIERLIYSSGEVQGFWMFAVSAFGLVVNIVMALLLGHDHGHGGHGHDHGHGQGHSHDQDHDDSDHDHNGAGHSHRQHAHTTHSPGNNASVIARDRPSLQQPFLKHYDKAGHHVDSDHYHDGADHSHEQHAHTTHGHGCDVTVITRDYPSLQQPLLKHSDKAGHHVDSDSDQDSAGHSHEHHTHTTHCHGCDVTVITDPKNAKKKKKQRNINVQGAYLHVLGDSIQSVGVMIGGAIIWYKPEWKIIDLICTLIFSVVVLGTTVNMLRNILEVLMESTPREIDATRLEKGLCEMEGVVAVHELHIWAITVGKVLLACHVTITREADPDLILDKVIGYINREYNISHVTIQIERE